MVMFRQYGRSREVVLRRYLVNIEKVIETISRRYWGEGVCNHGNIEVAPRASMEGDVIETISSFIKAVSRCYRVSIEVVPSCCTVKLAETGQRPSHAPGEEPHEPAFHGLRLRSGENLSRPPPSGGLW